MLFKKLVSFSTSKWKLDFFPSGNQYIFSDVKRLLAEVSYIAVVHIGLIAKESSHLLLKDPQRLDACFIH